MRSRISEAVTFGLSQQLLYEMDIDIELILHIPELLAFSHLRNMLEDLGKEILTEGSSLIGNRII